MTKYLLTTALAGLLAATSLAAPSPTSAEVYKELDQNHDGKVTDKEFVDTIVIIAFQKTDANGDGKIDAKEWAATAKGAQGKKDFAALDANKDGVVDKQEFTQNPAKRAVLRLIFLTIDPNDDGVLGAKEVPTTPKKN